MAALRSDGSGLLVSVSRGISKAKDMAAPARELRDDINKSRQTSLAILSKKATAGLEKGNELLEYQSQFISFALTNNVLQFGSFKLKSGRISPYFFNAGLFCSGASLHALSRYCLIALLPLHPQRIDADNGVGTYRFYAQAIRQSGIAFDVIFGPAYKGIPLATAISVAWYQLYGESKDVSYNRKEVKDHGEGGQLVGASIQGRRVLVVDDVITAGTAIRESVDILSHAKAELVGVAVSLDRQEKATDASTTSAIQQVETDLGVPVISIVRLSHLVSFVRSAGDGMDKNLQAIVDYRQTYGVEY